MLGHYEEVVRLNFETAKNELEAHDIMVIKCARSDAHRPDLIVSTPLESTLFEIKTNWVSQMGGTSVRIKGDEVEVVNDAYWKVTKDAILCEAVAYKNNLKEVARTFGAEKIPFVCTKERWKAAVRDGIIKSVNTCSTFNEKFVVDHYLNEGVEYIEIGGLGLYCLGSNPLNLDIPNFQCDIKIEMRLSRSGSNISKEGIEVVAAGYRAQARILKKPPVSPMSLNSIEDCKTIINALINKK